MFKKSIALCVVSIVWLLPELLFILCYVAQLLSEPMFFLFCGCRDLVDQFYATRIRTSTCNVRKAKVLRDPL